MIIDEKNLELSKKKVEEKQNLKDKDLDDKSKNSKNNA